MPRAIFALVLPLLAASAGCSQSHPSGPDGGGTATPDGGPARPDAAPGVTDASPIPDPPDTGATDDAGTPDAAAGDGGASLCTRLCRNAFCGPWPADRCVDECRAAAADCTAGERAQAAECAGLCDALVPCLYDVACMRDDEDSPDAGARGDAIACGASDCAVGDEYCYGCVPPEDGDATEPTCQPAGEPPPPHGEGDGCGWWHVMAHCDGPEDCAGDCVYGEFDVGMARCEVAVGPGGCVEEDPAEYAIRGVTVCHDLSDCPACATECKPVDDYAWLSGAGLTIGLCAM